MSRPEPRRTPGSRADPLTPRHADELRAAARAWIADDPDPQDRAELTAILQSGDDGELAARFDSPLTFGTAGIRGPLGAGPARMNRATVRRVAVGLARYLQAAHGAAVGPVVVGFDARHRSDTFAAEVASVLTGAGLRVLRLPGPAPTPVLAFAVRHLQAAAGVMITASHNPREDNGVKVYWSDGAQIIPPVDTGIAAAALQAGPLPAVPLGGPGEPLGGDVADAYLKAILAAIPPAAHRDNAGHQDPERAVAGRAPATRVPGSAGPDAPSAVAQDAATGITGDAGTDAGTAAQGTGAVGADALGEDASGAARRDLRIAYTPLHGVGLALLRRAFRQAGFAGPAVVAEQAEPDAAFPTLPKPNPEEPGALDLLMAEGARSGAELLLANDPDADRLAVALPDHADPGANYAAAPGADHAADPGAGHIAAPGADHGWRVLSGDEIGALLGDYLLRHADELPRPGTPEQRLLVTTVVSADLLGRMAAAAGARFTQTLTGFKWIMRGADEVPGEVPGSRFLFGYEEALGYAVTDVVRDKDGISAALVLAGAAAEAKSAGGTLAGVLDDIARQFGLFATSQWSVDLSGGKDSAGQDTGAEAGAALLEAARTSPPVSLRGQPVVVIDDLGLGLRSRDDGTKDPLPLPRSDVIIWRCADGTRVALRPSGTEPKVKIYLQVVLPAAGHSDLAPLRAQAARRLAELREEITEVLRL